MKLKTLVLVLTILGLFAAADLYAFEVKLNVTVPHDTPLQDNIYVVGTFNKWNPADENYLLENYGDHYELTMNLYGRITFKISRGDWETVEKGSQGEEVRDRVYVIARDREIDIEVSNWRDMMGPPSIPGTITGTVRLLKDVHSPELDNRRTVIVYLPPGYEKSKESYPVFYMQDGQNIFNRATGFAGQEWEVDECAENLIMREIIRPVIIVGIYNLGLERMNEYSPWKDPKYEMGGKGDEYVEFLCNTLKPLIDKKFRTSPDRKNTFIGGSSMGGLISHYAVLKRPDVFFGAAVMSPSFHYAGRKIFKYTRDNMPDEKIRFYHDVGTCETGDPKRDRAFVEQVKDMSEMVKISSETRLIIGDGHNHSEAAWRHRMPEVLKYLIGK